MYTPQFAQRKLSDSARENAENYILVIDHYDLAYEFNGGELVRVDAYAGTVERFSPWVE